MIVRDRSNDPLWARIAAVRMKGLGLTQNDLCEPLGVNTRGAVGHYFSGRRKLSQFQLVNLSTFLHLSVSELLGEQKLYTDITDNELLALFHKASPEAQKMIVAALRAIN